jgi:2-oxoglutarate dehydrogenase E2 component (dihydrolipoamide succinyltransferase)
MAENKVTQVTVPQIGESVTEGTVAHWHKNPGDTVQEGEPLFELESDKATMTVPSPASGVLQILVATGTDVGIGTPVAEIEKTGIREGQTRENVLPSETDPPHNFRPEPEPEPVPEPPAEPEIPGPNAASTLRAASTLDTRTLGENAPDSKKSGQSFTRKKVSRLRKTVAETLVAAKHAAAHVTTFNELEMTRVMDLRSRYRDSFEKAHGVKLGFMSFFVTAAVDALKEFPEVNAFFEGDAVRYNHYYNIAIAVSTDRGLLTPVIRDADTLSLAGIEKRILSFATRAAERRLEPDELTGGTFTISNGGVFGSMLSTPIPNPPQTAVLGMHAIQKRPVVRDDQIVIRSMMYLALTYDHRILDGREAIGFLNRIREGIENPGGRLLLEM